MAMDPNPKNFPILSYVMQRIPSLTPRTAATSSPSGKTTAPDLEQPSFSSKSSPSSSSPGGCIEIVTQMPHLAHPEVLASMTNAITDVAKTRSLLRTLGPRPDHETVDNARAKLAEIEASISESFEEISLSPNSKEVEEKEQHRREAMEKEKNWYKSLLRMDELHEAYEKLLKEAEERLVKIYESAEKDAADGSSSEEKANPPPEVNEEVVAILEQASGNVLESVDLSGRKIRYLPEAFGRIQGLLVLNLSSNQLEAIPDSIAGLQKLEQLDASTNLLESLPDSIGLLSNLKILNVSGNKLTALPDSICHCESLVELDVSFNRLTYLPTNIGLKLVNLKRLLIYLNKIRSLPTSVGEMRSLIHLDAHFNELGGLPVSFGKLTNLECLNLSSNFNDLTELPFSFGELINLKELDLSNNQIHALPDTFGRLDSLTKLNLEQNPLVIPPGEVVKEGVEAVKIYMAKRWIEILAEEERKHMLEESNQANVGWLTRTTSKLKTYVSEVSDTVNEYLGAKSPRDPCLDQQL